MKCIDCENLDEALNCIDPRCRKAIIFYYGLDIRRKRSIREVCEKYRVSRSRAQKVIDHGLKALKKIIREKEYEDNSLIRILNVSRETLTKD